VLVRPSLLVSLFLPRLRFAAFPRPTLFVRHRDVGGPGWPGGLASSVPLRDWLHSLASIAGFNGGVREPRRQPSAPPGSYSSTIATGSGSAGCADRPSSVLVRGPWLKWGPSRPHGPVFQIRKQARRVSRLLRVGLTFRDRWTPFAAPSGRHCSHWRATRRPSDGAVGIARAYSLGLRVPSRLLGRSRRLPALLQTLKRPLIQRGWKRGAGVLLGVVGVLVAHELLHRPHSWTISLTPAWLLSVVGRP